MYLYILCPVEEEQREWKVTRESLKLHLPRPLTTHTYKKNIDSRYDLKSVCTDTHTYSFSSGIEV